MPNHSPEQKIWIGKLFIVLGRNSTAHESDFAPFFGGDKWSVPSEIKLPLAHYRPEIADFLLAKIIVWILSDVFSS